MSILFMTKYEREVLYKILEDRSKFWVYGEQEACFEDDVKSLILQGMRNTRFDIIQEISSLGERISKEDFTGASRKMVVEGVISRLIRKIQERHVQTEG